MVGKLSCFKAYDVRGLVPKELNEQIVYYIGRAFAQFLKPKKVIIGRDIRLESLPFSRVLAKGLMDEGVQVLDIGLCGTEEVYFHTFNGEKEGVGGGIMITASHNPKGHNGLKFVREKSIPLSSTAGLDILEKMVQDMLTLNIPVPKEFDVKAPLYQKKEEKALYITHLLSYVNKNSLKPLRILVNPGNGCAGPIIRELERHLPFHFIYLHEEPNGYFPHGVPNPLLPQNRQVTSRAVRAHQADFGLAWDGDFDRCFFFDEKGNFIEGYYLVGVLAQHFLERFSGEAVVFDPRLIWNTLDIISQEGGKPRQCRSGHAFMKSVMREENAIYGGEMTAHHYFRDFSYCDSGMIPWLIMTERLSHTSIPLSQMVQAYAEKYPCSGELNYEVSDSLKVIERILAYYEPYHPEIDRIDGISLSFDSWRFNVRVSNTEPLLRLNIETRKDKELLLQKQQELNRLILNG